MARYQGSFDELLIIGSKLPWRVATCSAIGIFVGLHVVAVQTSSPATGTTLADLGGVVHTASSSTDSQRPGPEFGLPRSFIVPLAHPKGAFE
jgi:hypothetical protein